MTNISYTEGYADKSVLKEIYDLKRNVKDIQVDFRRIYIGPGVPSDDVGEVGDLWIVRP